MLLRFQGIHPPYGFEILPVSLCCFKEFLCLFGILDQNVICYQSSERCRENADFNPSGMMALKLTISHMEMTLYSTVSFPYFFKPATNLMTSNLLPALAFGKLFNIKVLPAQNTDIYFGFHFRLFLDPFLALALFCQSYQDHEQKRKQNRNVPLLICLNPDHIIYHICH